MQSTPAGWVSQTFQVGMFTARSFEGGNCWVLGVGGFINPIRLLTLTQFHRILCITCASGWQSKLTSWPWHWTWDLEISQGMRIFSSIYIYDPGSRFATTPPPPTWYGPKTCVLQHSAWKRCICSVFCMVGCWCGPQPCKFVGFLQPTFRKRVICNVSASTSWSSAAAPSSISVSNYHIILNLLLRVFSLGTGLISVYILCLSNFLLECLVFRNWSNLKFS